MGLENFPFIDREAELERLMQDFRAVSRARGRGGAKGYLLKGPRGIGKSRLVEEFVRRVSEDLTIAADIQNFKVEDHVIVQTCSPAEEWPYHSMSQIAERLQKLEKPYVILKKLKDVLLAAANVKELFDSLLALFREVNPEEKAARRIRREKLRLYLRFRKGIRRLSRKAPLILHFKDAQWLDADSLELLKDLLDGQSAGGDFWGMVFLEEEDTAGEKAAKNREAFRNLKNRGLLIDTRLQKFDKGFEAKILAPLLGEHLFTVREYDLIYTHSNGLPGELQVRLGDWIKQGLLRRTERGWVKDPGFEEQILPPIEKLINLIISFAKDNRIDESERQLIRKTARMLGISEEVYNSLIELVLLANERGYQIERRIYGGALSKHAFLAFDTDRRPLVLEFLDKASLANAEIEDREIHHRNIVNVHVTIIPGRGQLIVYDYDGETIRALIDRSRFAQQRQCLKSARQIAEALQELHRNGYVHGVLHPEAVIADEGGRFRVLGIDVCRTERLLLDDDVRRRYLPYMAPELLRGQPCTERCDIYSFGMILHNLLTNDYPFPCDTPDDIQKAQHILDWMRFQDVAEEIRPILSRCLHPNPRLRYDSMAELLQELREAEDGSGKNGLQQDGPRETPPVERRLRSARKPRAAIAAAAVVVGLLGLGAYLLWPYVAPHPLDVEKNTVLVDVVWSIPPSEHERLEPGMLDYLIQADLTQSTNLIPLNPREAQQLLTGRKLLPEYELHVDIGKSAGLYAANVGHGIGNHPIGHHKVSFAGVEALLQREHNKIREITAPLDTSRGRPLLMLTSDWEAFWDFFQGEIAWSKLEVRADSSYRAALAHDAEFVLSTLRSAQVLRFNGQTNTALAFVNSVRDKLEGLGEIEEQRAQALIAGLGGNFDKEASILAGLFGQLHLRKEAAYDAAEAYYRVCNIKGAIDYYTKAILLDPNYALALNHLAYCYSHLGDHDKAIGTFQAYVDLDSTANAYDSLGDGLMSAGRLDEAAAAKLEGLRKNPRLNYLHQALCYINVLRGRLNEAETNATSYLTVSTTDEEGIDPEIKAQALYLSALVAYYRGELDRARDYCEQALNQYCPFNLVTRNHDLHWLYGLICLQSGDVPTALAELDNMKMLTVSHHITAEHYYMNIYKNMRHLESCIEAEHGVRGVLDDCVGIFNGGLRDKVKDHSSPFDLAFFNTEFARLYLEKFPGDASEHAAEQCLKLALEYNANYPFALYWSWRLYDKRGDAQKAAEMRSRLDKVWAHADPDVRARHGL